MVVFLPAQQSCVAFTCVALCGEVMIYDFRTATVVLAIRLPQIICSLAPSPTRALVAAGGVDASVFLIDSGAGGWRELAGHVRAVRSVAFASSGACVVSGSGATMLRWNVDDGSAPPAAAPT